MVNATPKKSGGLALVLLSVLSALFLAELGLRLMDFSFYWPLSRDPNPLTGWAAKPGTQGWQRLEGEAFIQINQAGWRDISHPLSAEPKRFRIALLGDSFTEAVQIPLSQTYWRLLPDYLQRCHTPLTKPKEVEIINFAVSGYSTAQALMVLENHVAPYRPDLVILAFFTGNDIQENSQTLGGDAMRPTFDYSEGELVLNRDFRDSEEYQSKSRWMGRFKSALLHHSRLAQAVARAWYLHHLRLKQQASVPDTADLSPSEPGVDVRVYQPPKTQAWQSAWRVTEGLLKRMNDKVKKENSRFLVITLTNGAQVHPDPQFRAHFKEQLGLSTLFYADERIRQIGVRHGFPVLNLAPGFQQFATQTGIWLHGFKNTAPGVGHWNENGHQLAAQSVADFLCQHSELMALSRE
ncbi:MAG: SGNH/GDSL hydrolase family protein [Magnetococcales bacterium]|nr:SGNH/GDSL hydrolase family protein [Magnetococcales bacterium]